MSSNDQIILDQVLEQQRAERASHLAATKYFELFLAEQLLKHYDLSYDEIEPGLVDGGGDGGIDGFFVFVNGELVREDTDLSGLKKDVVIETIIFQAKTEASFREKALDGITATLRDLFDLSQQLTKFAGAYNKELLAAVELFRNAVKTLAPRFPKHSFSLYYASKGVDVHPNVTRKAEQLEALVKSQFQGSDCAMRFLTATDLLALARETPRLSYQLEVTDASINTKGGVVALVKLREFAKFIRDEKDELRRSLFEANVRDYQGATQVNEEIRRTLADKWSEDFWWLNNGITIVAGRKPTQTGKTLTVEDPQIVNGLQTSREIFAYFRTANTDREEREILVRVISPETPESRDRVIKATNSQTPISPASLRATDKIQRDIEQYLRSFGLFYDRRKNFYKNEGKQIDRIISIPAMAQALMAVVLQKPGTARARPSSLLKKDEDYERVFSGDFPIELFRAAIELSRLADARLRGDATLTPEDRVNLKFYVAMYVAALACNAARPKPEQIAKLAAATIDKALLDRAMADAKSVYQQLGGTALAAKGSEFGDELISMLDTALPAAATTA
ncbi:MAG: AIPR family protein [Bryobacterales bacterium]|nr:AIPR family protein [Bryobacterales bacterium]